jgi:hypothetical protein
MRTPHYHRPSLSEPLIVYWIYCYRERNGRWPGISDTDVWAKDGETFVRLDESWRAIDSAMRLSRRGLPYLGTLNQFKEKLGLPVLRRTATGYGWMRQHVSP